MSGDDGAAPQWLDMSRYPGLDPDQAIPAASLAALRDLLLGHEIAPLPGEAWQAVLGAAISGAAAATVPDLSGGAPGDPPHAASWRADPAYGWHDGFPPGPLAGGHDFTDPHTDGSAHPDGGHW